MDTVSFILLIYSTAWLHQTELDCLLHSRVPKNIKVIFIDCEFNQTLRVIDNKQGMLYIVATGCYAKKRKRP